MPYLITLLGDCLLTRQRAPTDLRSSPRDVYLAPHCDDIAFSIGRFAAVRGRGRLVTVFSRSNFTLRPGLAGLPTEEVAALRRAEERQFAAACGLVAMDLGLTEAPLRGQRPMDHAKAGQELAVLAPSILPALLALEEEQPRSHRPWLFAPMALGGHLDHVILLQLIALHRKALSRRFRLAFYEDLPYAVRFDERVEGLTRFRALFGSLRWRRFSFALGGNIQSKLDLLSLYESQHATPPDISGYSPQNRPPQPPHEAIWVTGLL